MTSASTVSANPSEIAAHPILHFAFLGIVAVVALVLAVLFVIRRRRS